MDSAKRRIFNLIADTAGLQPEAIPIEVWDRLLQERMALSGASNLEAYHKLLLISPYEWQELVERLIVPETWFFRDPAAFDLLVHYCRQRRSATRLLSVPCATGEEPYSIVMALLDAQVPAEKFQVDAIDISKLSLLRAEKGLYTNHSFRGRPAEFRARYFDEQKEGYQLKKEVRDRVHFGYGNICDHRFVEGKPLYDVILCRNLLIYLHPQAQKRALQACARLLQPEGMLIVAPAEALIAQRHGFVSQQLGRSFVLHKAEGKKVLAKRAQKHVQAEATPRLVKTENEPAHQNELLLAQELADRGDFREAERLCRHYLEEKIMDAEGYFLLGAIRHAQGDEKEAEGCFMKTVYLQPHHDQALVYLALLAEKRGDKSQAAQFRRRIK